MDALDQVWARQQGVFHEKFEKMTLEHSVLERMENMGIKVVCFLENGRFLQNMGMRALIFSRKIRKKEILLTFLAHNVVLTELKFL